MLSYICNTNVHLPENDSSEWEEEEGGGSSRG